MNIRKKLIIAAAVLALLAILCAIWIFSINAYVVSTTKSNVITVEEAAAFEDIDCILVLGCLVRSNGTPSNMLEDRLLTGLELYDCNAAPKLLMSGDHGRDDYNEVGAMKDYAVERNVPSSDVFTDHAGFSTYESIYRAKEIFGADKILIVTQEYHLYRALYIAKSLGIEAFGVCADKNTYAGQTMRDIREILARNKDFFSCVFKPKPTYLGNAIPVDGNGDLSNG